MHPRTRRQREVLEIITRYIKAHGYEPSYQQIAMQLGVNSKAGIARYIEALERQGFITRKRENGSFLLELRAENAIARSVCEIEWLDVPRNLDLLEDWEDDPLFVPVFLIGSQTPDRMRAFRAPNNSMLDEQICEGDIVLIEKRGYARDGDIVAALIDNKRAVLKKFYRFGAKVELRPSNPNYDSIILSADKVTVLGVYRCLLRPSE